MTAAEGGVPDTDQSMPAVPKSKPAKPASAKPASAKPASANQARAAAATKRTLAANSPDQGLDRGTDQGTDPSGGPSTKSGKARGKPPKKDRGAGGRRPGEREGVVGSKDTEGKKDTDNKKDTGGKRRTAAEKASPGKKGADSSKGAGSRKGASAAAAGKPTPAATDLPDALGSYPVPVTTSIFNSDGALGLVEPLDPHEALEPVAALDPDEVLDPDELLEPGEVLGPGILESDILESGRDSAGTVAAAAAATFPPEDIDRTRESRWSTRDRVREQELLALLSELPEGDPQRAAARDELVTMHMPLAAFLARRFRDRGEHLDDLTQVATVGLIKAVDRFEPGRGVEFSTFATPTIVGEIKRHFRDKGWAIRVPRRLQELRLAITRATAELSQQTGTSPTVAQLAAHLGISEDEVLEGLESAAAYATVSLDSTSGDSSQDSGSSIADTMGEHDPNLAEVEHRATLHPLLAKLGEREQRIVYMRFFENKTQAQIASEIGVSQMHISRLLSKSLAQMRAEIAPLD